jgi:hypothetical protein
MTAQKQASNANTADALQAIFFLLQVGLTIYSLGAFTPGAAPPPMYLGADGWSHLCC